MRCTTGIAHCGRYYRNSSLTLGHSETRHGAPSVHTWRVSYTITTKSMNEYDKQAQDFLTKTETTISIVEAVPQDAPAWAKGEKHGIKYSVTLKNARHDYTFPFWDSIHNAERIEWALYEPTAGPRYHEAVKDADMVHVPHVYSAYGKTMREKVAQAYRPSAYDVLACLSPFYGDTFEDFCATYGYDEDSRTAERTYHEVIEQDRQLRKLFTAEEMDLLAEIA